MKLTNPIPYHNFELIRDRICLILATEYCGQNETKNVKVWRERSIPFDLTELPAVNVAFDRVTFEPTNPKAQTGDLQFYIDIHVREKHAINENGDTLSSITAQRIAGITRYILMSPEYYLLDFDPGTVFYRFIDSIVTGKANVDDSQHVIVNRVSFKVKANEFVNDLVPVTAEMFSTQIKLEETNKGHYLIIEQND